MSKRRIVPAEERHPSGRKVRREALPEYANYKDTGCDLAPSCLSCPFVRCRYDKHEEKKR